MYHQTAHSGCTDGPCPLMMVNAERRKTALQGYPETEDMEGVVGPTPEGEARIEMDTDTFEFMLAQHLSDDAWARIGAMRREWAA